METNSRIWAEIGIEVLTADVKYVFSGVILPNFILNSC